MASKRKIKPPAKQSEPERKYKAIYETAEKLDPYFASLMRKPYNKRVRLCNKCRVNEFLSEGPHHRMCSSCKKENERASRSQVDIIYLDQILHTHSNNSDIHVED